MSPPCPAPGSLAGGAIRASRAIRSGSVRHWLGPALSARARLRQPNLQDTVAASRERDASGDARSGKASGPPRPPRQPPRSHEPAWPAFATPSGPTARPRTAGTAPMPAPPTPAPHPPRLPAAATRQPPGGLGRPPCEQPAGGRLPHAFPRSAGGNSAPCWRRRPQGRRPARCGAVRRKTPHAPPRPAGNEPVPNYACLPCPPRQGATVGAGRGGA